MPIRKVVLSTKGLKRVNQGLYENDFTFVLGDEKYRCPGLIAEFLSPRISSLRQEDATVAEFHLETPDPDRLFPNILAMGFVGDSRWEVAKSPLYEMSARNCTTQTSLT
jgi:hypothetical protein